MIRLLVRIVAVFAVGLGVGILAWGIAAALKNETIRTPAFIGDSLVQSPSEVIGWGAGILAVGLTALVLTLIHRSSSNEWDE